MNFSKNGNIKKHAPKVVFFNENFFWKGSDNFKVLTSKVRNWHFWISWFRMYIYLPKTFKMKKCHLSLNYATIWCWSYWKFFKWYLLFIRYLLRFFDCLAHPNLSANFATDEKWPLCHLRISYQSLAGSLGSLKNDIRVIFCQWKKLYLGLNALSNQKILKGI